SGSLKAFCYALGVGFTGQQAGDAGLWSIGQVTLELAPVSGEAGTAVQVNNPAQVPGSFRTRTVTRPGGLANGLLVGGAHGATPSTAFRASCCCAGRRCLSSGPPGPLGHAG